MLDLDPLWQTQPWAGAVTGVRAGEVFAARAGQVTRLHLESDGSVSGSAPDTAVLKVCSTLAEWRWHTDLAPLAPPGIGPALYGAQVEAGGCRLLLEDLSAWGAHPGLPYADEVLRLAARTLAGLHAAFWNHPALARLEAPTDVTRLSTAGPGLSARLAGVRPARTAFIRAHGAELTPAEHALLRRLFTRWPEAFWARSAGGPLTLLHGDAHLYGNGFVAAGRLRFIDWETHKRGLPTFDLMYALLPAGVQDRVERDTELLRVYHTALEEAGVPDYSWDACLFDYRLSLLTNLFQSLLQGSLKWFRLNAGAARAWQADRLL